MSDAFYWPDYLPAFRNAAALARFDEIRMAETSSGPVSAWVRPGAGPQVYLSAGIHGDEPAGPLALLTMMEQSEFSLAFAWAICPALNPSGLAMLQRENSNGIDLNRDYWLRRTPEVKAHAEWLSSQPRPDLFLSLHEDWESSGFYFYEINLGADQRARAQSILEAVNPWFAPEPGRWIDGHVPREAGWIYHEAEADLPEGWPEAIFLAKQGCPLSFTFETPSQANLTDRIAAHMAAVKAALQFTM